MTFHKTCDGVQRRDFLKAGALGASGLTLASFLKLSAAGAVKSNAKAKSAIFINLPGGPSHMDSFDLKPDAPKEYRGLFNPIKTNADGVEISEHLPKLAKCADKFVILRGVSHALGAHALGQEYVNTGTRPLASLEYPAYGSVVAKELSAPPDLPPYVAIPSHRFGAGYLGVKYAPLNTGATPRAGVPFSVRGITLQNGLTVSEVEKRQNLLNDLDKTFAGLESSSQLLDGLDKFSQQAYAMITSRRAREAFDISKESPEFVKPFTAGAAPTAQKGKRNARGDAFGLSCLLATRLIEAGVRFCTVSLGGWDTHRDNFSRLKDQLLPTLDTGLSALLNGLEQKGLLESTAVYVTGEFGRTPKINSRSTPGGRDHYPRCMFMLLAGGAIRGGQVVGKSDDKATLPANEAITPDDVAASFYHNLGIDPSNEYHTAIGRPIMIVRNGHVLKELFS